MSQTIAIGFSPKDGIDPFDQVKNLASLSGYNLLKGLDFGESEMSFGLVEFQRIGFVGGNKKKSFSEVFYFQTSDSPDAALCYGIYEEMMNFELEGERPKFFYFLNELSKVSEELFDNIFFFFASEWDQGDRVRYVYGSYDDLTAFLSVPGAWNLRFWNPVNGIIQETDDIPTVFQITG